MNVETGWTIASAFQSVSGQLQCVVAGVEGARDVRSAQHKSAVSLQVDPLQ
jgi:hypothetical protein